MSAIVDGKITLTIQCPSCKKENDLVASAKGIKEWRQGNRKIQDALPELAPNQREALITGTCQECWDKMFKEPEDDKLHDTSNLSNEDGTSRGNAERSGPDGSIQ